MQIELILKKGCALGLIWKLKCGFLELGNGLLNSTKDMKVYSTTEESAEEFHLNDHIRGFGPLAQMIEPYQFIQNNKWYVKVHRNCWRVSFDRMVKP